MRTEKLESTIDLYCTITGVTKGTKRLHEIWLLHLERMLRRVAIVDDFSDLNYAKYVEYRTPKASHETIRGECCKLLAVWRWCAGGNRRWIDFPEVKALLPQYRLPKALDKEQLERLWQAARTYPKIVGTLPGNLVFTALLYVLWDTSERIGAVHKIHRDNIDLVRGWVMIDPTDRKGGRQGRLYKIRPATVTALRDLMQAFNGPQPFGECTANNLYQHFPYLRTAANLPRWVTFHTIRKSHASHLTAMGGDARLSLGHSSDVITNRHYIDSRIAGEGKSPSDILFDPGQRSWWKKLIS